MSSTNHPALKIGETTVRHFRVEPQHSISLGDSEATVLATPSMILWMELTAKAALAPVLGEGQDSVGVSVSVEHLAPTPLGSEVRCEATITAQDRAMIDFTVTARDAREVIGRGAHRRAMVPLSKILQRIADKSAQLGSAVQEPAMNSGVPQVPSDTPPSGLRTLKLQVQGASAELLLDRPEKLNAVNQQMTGELEQVTAWLAAHEEIRVVVVRGAGRAFCAGDDVPEVGELSLADATRLSLRQAAIYLQWRQLPQVLIAAIDGPAMGAGCVAAVACDFRLASNDATFGMPEIVLGWNPGYGLSELLELVGPGRALELCLTGEPIAAREAVQAGLAHRALPRNQLDDAVAALRQRLLAMPARAVRETKRLLRRDLAGRAVEACREDTEAYIGCLATDDAREGIAAFKQKRPPRFGE